MVVVLAVVASKVVVVVANDVLPSLVHVRGLPFIEKVCMTSSCSFHSTRSSCRPHLTIAQYVSSYQLSNAPTVACRTPSRPST